MKKTILIMGGAVLMLIATSVSAQQTTPQQTTPQQTQPTTQPADTTPQKPVVIDSTKQMPVEQQKVETTTTTPTTTTTTTTTPTTTSNDPWDPAKNPTVDSITAPFRGKMIPARPALTTADIFPVIGKYTSTTNPEAASVTISLDEQNKGLVWIEGLPQGKLKAMLRKSPSTYKIPAQKTEDGKDVPEGTLVFDKVAGTLNIVIGKPYNAEDPASAFVVATTEEVAATDANATTTTPDATTTDAGKKVVKTKTKVKGQPTVKTKVKTPEAPKPWMYSGTKVDATVMN